MRAALGEVSCRVVTNVKWLRTLLDSFRDTHAPAPINSIKWPAAGAKTGGAVDGGMPIFSGSNFVVGFPPAIAADRSKSGFQRFRGYWQRTTGSLEIKGVHIFFRPSPTANLGDMSAKPSSVDLLFAAAVAALQGADEARGEGGTLAFICRLRPVESYVEIEALIHPSRSAALVPLGCEGRINLRDDSSDLRLLAPRLNQEFTCALDDLIGSSNRIFLRQSLAPTDAFARAVLLNQLRILMAREAAERSGGMLTREVALQQVAGPATDRFREEQFLREALEEATTEAHKEMSKYRGGRLHEGKESTQKYATNLAAMVRSTRERRETIARALSCWGSARARRESLSCCSPLPTSLPGGLVLSPQHQVASVADRLDKDERLEAVHNPYLFADARRCKREALEQLATETKARAAAVAAASGPDCYDLLYSTRMLIFATKFADAAAVILGETPAYLTAPVRPVATNQYLDAPDHGATWLHLQCLHAAEQRLAGLVSDGAEAVFGDREFRQSRERSEKTRTPVRCRFAEEVEAIAARVLRRKDASPERSSG